MLSEVHSMNNGAVLFLTQSTAISTPSPTPDSPDSPDYISSATKETTQDVVQILAFLAAIFSANNHL